MDDTLTSSGISRESALGYLVLRACVGVNLAMHGIVRLAVVGPAAFVASLDKQFQATFLPAWSVHAFGYTLPWVEALIGLLLLLGLRTRDALVAGGLVIAVLTFGICLVQQWDTAGTQLLYALVFAALLLTIGYNDFSLDSMLNKRRSL